MKRTAVCFAVLVVAAQCAAAADPKQAHLEQYGNIPVLHLYGTREEMGAQYGRLMAPHLQLAFAALKLVFPGEALARVKATGQMIEPNLPEVFRKELRAVARSAGIPYDDLLAANTAIGISCTALAAWGKTTNDGDLVMGRNVDYFSMGGLAETAGLIVVYHPQDGHALVSLTFLGIMGSFTGINEKGVAYGSLLVFNAKEPGPRKDGLPVHVLMREAAHASDRAVGFGRALRQAKHLIPVNVMAADADVALALELGTEKTAVRNGENDCLIASNHFRSPALAARKEQCKRYATLEEAVRRHRGKFDSMVMQKALSDARMERMNVQAVVFEPKKMRMHVSMNRNPAAQGPYTTFDLKKLLADDGNPVIEPKPRAQEEPQAQEERKPDTPHNRKSSRNDMR